jgi:hypothetical protein
MTYFVEIGKKSIFINSKISRSLCEPSLFNDILKKIEIVATIIQLTNLAFKMNVTKQFLQSFYYFMKTYK